MSSSFPSPARNNFSGSSTRNGCCRCPFQTDIMIDLNHSQNLAARPRAGYFSVLILLAGLLAMRVTLAADLAATNTPSAIPWNEIGAKAGADYKGDGLAVTPTASGARLHCIFQRLDGEATAEGLWLTSTVTNTVSDRFRVTAMAVGRVAEGPLTPSLSPSDGERVADTSGEGQLPRTGSISVCGQTVRFSRPGLTEEYSVSMDGVRQDFIAEQAPPSPPGGELVLKLAVIGAQVESRMPSGLVLDHSGRKIAYSRLRVTDATGKELPARMEVCPAGDEATSLNSWVVFDKDIEERSPLTPAPASGTLAVVVNDAEAVYPVRIDPTFSDANWVSMGSLPGANGQVNAAVTDGSGNLYIGGDFTAVGNAVANSIAEWNGSSWSALGSGMNDSGAGSDGYGPVVHALAVSGGTLYAGGDFTTAGGIAAHNIAQWNGTNWSALGSGITGPGLYMEPAGHVLALAVSGNTLYAGGDFTTAGGIASTNIAQWNGSSWSALGSGMNGRVSALAVSGSTLYAGGNFTTAGGIAASSIAQWNGTTWSALGSGISGLGDGNGPYVSALAVSGGTLYAGGDFDTAGSDTNAYDIAQWNGTTWSALGSGVDGDVNALAVSGGTLYAGGYFTSAGGTAANNIAQWNGSSWSALGSGIGGNGADVLALAVSGSTLYVGGDLTTVGASTANSIAQWNGTTWSALGSEILGSGISGGDQYGPAVTALAVSGSTLYAGGDFTQAGASAANNIAQWNGSSWSALGSGMNYFVSALAVSGSTLYAGGDFTTAGGSAATNIAQWNGSSWSALGSGMNDLVDALAVSGGTLYAGGYFTSAGGSAAKYIAQWNGSSWSPLGSGMNSSVSALAVSGSTLYAGGYFTNAGGSTANYIAQWNGSSWTPLGSGMGGSHHSVSALAVSGSTLYAGGQFTTAGGVAANYIAQWNGSSWSALGSGVSYGPNGAYVSALAVSGSTLYAGGLFTTAGGNPANYIAQWNGSSWSPLGSGVSGGDIYGTYVDALAVSGGTLYAGGDFTTAGTNVSAHAAMANLPVPPTLSIIADGANMVLTWPDAASGFTTGYTLESATDLVPPVAWQTNSTAPIVIGGQNVIIIPITGSQQFFRLVNP
jgi:hypothetical protein